jgi:nucleotidyltransferase substrate binding protein (TIGR01987 family)
MDVRWQQRFENYSKSLRNLERALALESPDIVQRAGLIQFFETVFELSWKVMKDYLEDGGYQDIRSPREAIKKFFEIGMIEEGSAWLKGLEDRNLTAHTYNEATAEKVVHLIRGTYYPLFRHLEERLKSV